MIGTDSTADADPSRRISLHHDGPVVVEGDEVRLKQVLDNLLTNARVHTPSGTPTHVTVSLESKGGDRSGLYFLQEGVAEAAAVGLRCAWSDLLVGLKNFLEAGETGFTEPYTAQVQAP